MMQTTLKSAIAKGIITNISGLRANTNTYPFVTLFSPLGTTNLYFGKRSAEKVLDAAKNPKFSILTFLAENEATIVLATNKDKNTRFKLSTSGDLKADVATKEDTLAAFGIDPVSVKEVEVPFNWELFRSEFETANVEEPVAVKKVTSSIPAMEEETVTED